MPFSITQESLRPVPPTVQGRFTRMDLLTKIVLVNDPVDHILDQFRFVMLVWDADVRQEPVRFAAALIGTLSSLDQQPVFLPSDLLVDPFHPVLFLEPSSAYRADRIFIAPY